MGEIENEESTLLTQMNDLGLDFSLTGTNYIYELFSGSKNPLINLDNFKLPNMSRLADRHNVKLKSLNRDVHWAIRKKHRLDEKLSELANYNKHNNV